MQKQAAEIDTYARDNIKDYKKLSSPAQSQIRRIIEDGRAKGVSDSDVLMYAKVAAHSGLDIVFDKGMNYRGVNEQGEDTYSDGFYSASRNTIFVNPEASRTQERLLIHELDHAIRKIYDKRGTSSTAGGPPSPRGRLTRVYKMAVDGVSEDIKKSIKKKYGDDPDVNADEANAYYAEIAFSNKHVLEKLIEAEPTLKEKILNFFKGASEDYADVPKLSGAAKRYYRTYKKLFDEFSARNQQNNAAENAHLSTLSAENAQKTPLTNMNSENMQVSGRKYAIVALDNGNTYVTATRKVIKGTTKQEQRKEITQFFNVLLDNKSSLDIHTVEGDILTITKAETAYKARDDYKTVGGKAVPMTEDEFKVKLNAEAHIDELAEISTSSNQKFVDTKNHSFAKDGFTYRTAYFEDFDGQYYKITLSVGHNGNIATIYSVGKITKSVPSSAKIIAVVGSKALDETLSNSIISQPAEKSNGFDKNSMEKSSGRQYALPIEDYYANGEEFATPTINTVGKE